ncbi:hypothetical protein QBC47DRAFT_393256 [Echria macrotheca]|uniref:Synaptobrevin n=1 Tax=Echria macrotheca TaxID=438768 RepID=A0AAJ0F239_9PEZI|nr:hypothetical protein QBC47DRAFT_393256 [Echria macrotheca]
MVRLIHGVAAATPTARQADPLTDLNRLLSRLQQSILRADAEREARLRASEFDRQKALQNVRYAQSLLTKLEQDALAVKIHARRQELQSDLNRKRETLEQISDRLGDLAELATRDDSDKEAGDTSGDEDEGEDILAEIIATPSESLDSTRSPDVAPEEEVDEGLESQDPIPDMLETPLQENPETKPEPAEPQPASELLSLSSPPTTTTTTQTLRARGGPNQPPSEKTYTSALFGDRRSPGTTATTTDMATRTEEAILDHQRAEQDALSESILRLASDLKASSQALSASLDEDKDVVDRAGRGMNKTGEGMDAVSRRMGMLTRMTEGEGWWGRMRLYAQIYGLMVVLVLVVFVLPKLRF